MRPSQQSPTHSSCSSSSPSRWVTSFALAALRNALKGTLIVLATLSLSTVAHSSAQKMTVLQVLERFPRDHNDLEETPEARHERLLTLSTSIETATQKRWEQDLLISVAWHESTLSSKVATCKIKGDKGKAVGYFQSWVFKDREDCPTVEETAVEAIRHLRSAWRWCKAKGQKQKVMRGVSLYGTGRACFSTFATKRYKLWTKIRRMRK